MNQQHTNHKGFTMKNLVTIGIFTALFFVFEMLGAFPFMLTPATMFFMSFGIALLCGPIILLLFAKVPKRGTITILGILNGIIWFMMGMHWGMDVGYVVMAVIADIVAGSKQYRSKLMNTIAYALFCLGPTGSFVIYFIDPSGWSATMLQNGTSQEMISAITASAATWVLPVILIGTLLVGCFSGWLGSKLLHKQFERAGITQ